MAWSLLGGRGHSTPRTGAIRVAVVGAALAASTAMAGSVLADTYRDPTGNVVGVATDGDSVTCAGYYEQRPAVVVAHGGGCAGGNLVGVSAVGGCAYGGVALVVGSTGGCQWSTRQANGAVGLGVLGADSYGLVSASDSGDASISCYAKWLSSDCWIPGAGVSVTGDARWGYAVSGTGDADGTHPWDYPEGMWFGGDLPLAAVSGTGDARSAIAVSGTGTATGANSSKGAALSVAGDASGAPVRATVARTNVLTFLGTTVLPEFPCAPPPPYGDGPCLATFDGDWTGELTGVADRSSPYNVAWNTTAGNRVWAIFAYNEWNCLAGTETVLGTAAGSGSAFAGAGEIKGNWQVPGETVPRSITKVNIYFSFQWTRTLTTSVITLRPATVTVDVDGLGTRTIYRDSIQDGVATFAATGMDGASVPMCSTPMQTVRGHIAGVVPLVSVHTGLR